MAIKLTNSNDNEVIIIIDKKHYPIAYGNKIEELVEQGCYPTIQDAEKDNPFFEMECELYYDKHSGLFAVEQGAVESGTIYSPYTAELCEEFDLD